MINIDSLSWDLPEEQQRQNIARICIESDDDIKMLILPYQKQRCWENCAILLSKLDDDVLIPFIPQLLEWYKDLNWPGLDIIHKRIKQFPSDVVNVALASALNIAKTEDDEEWVENLHSVFVLR